MNKMLLQQRFQVQVLILCTALLCLLPLNTAQALSTCQARYEAVVTHIDGMATNQVARLGDFQSQGRGRVSTRAATRAKLNAERCMQSHWQNRGTGMMPYECQDQLRISGYYVQNLEQALQQEICQGVNPIPCNQGSAQVSFSLYATVDGEPGCGIGTSTVSRTLLASNLTTLCQCLNSRSGVGWGHNWHRGPRRQIPAPQQISPAQGAVFYHVPRTTQVSWQPVRRAASYLVEVKYNGSLWTSLATTGNVTFATFDFPGSGQGQWRVTARNRRGRQGTPSPWYGFSYQR